MMSLEEVQRYVRAIRNPAKKDYAYQYVWWIRQGRNGEPPESRGLSCMGAQAVRLHLADFMPAAK